MSTRFFAAVLFLIISFDAVVAQEQTEVTLQQVISLAVSENYDISIARSSAEAFATDRSYIWAGFTPQINGVATLGNVDNRQNLRFEDGSDNRKGPNQSNTASAALQLSWVLFDGTRMFATAERLRTLDAQGQLLIKDQIVNSVASIINNYYDIVRQKQQVKAVREQMSVSSERVKLADRKLQVGTGGKPELLQAKVDYNSQLTLTLQQEALIVQLKEQLNAMVNSKLPVNYDVADSIVINLDIKEGDVNANLEQTNFSLQVSKLNMDIARLSVRERRAELYPMLTFNSSYTYSQTDNKRQINPFGALFNRTNGWNYGLTLNVPIFNGRNGQRLIQQAQIVYTQQDLLFNQLKLNTTVGVRNAYVNYDNAKKILLIEEETILLAKENVFIALEGFKRGITTYIELRTAQQSLADAYNRLISARYSAKIAETELLRLSGKLIQ